MLQALSELESLPFSWTLIFTLKKIFWDKNLPSIKSVSPLSPLLATWLCIPPPNYHTNIECWMWIVRWDVLDKSGCLKSNQEKWRMALEKPSHSKLSYYKAWAVLDIRVHWPQPPWEVHQLSTVWVDQRTRGRVSVEWRNLRRAELSLGSLQRQPGQPLGCQPSHRAVPGRETDAVPSAPHSVFLPLNLSTLIRGCNWTNRLEQAISTTHSTWLGALLLHSSFFTLSLWLAQPDRVFLAEYKWRSTYTAKAMWYLAGT